MSQLTNLAFIRARPRRTTVEQQVKKYREKGRGRGGSPSDLARATSIFPLPRGAAHSAISSISIQEETRALSGG
jgi:hypothetical protein